jgi:hypothetical protein
VGVRRFDDLSTGMDRDDVGQGREHVLQDLGLNGTIGVVLVAAEYEVALHQLLERLAPGWRQQRRSHSETAVAVGKSGVGDDPG